MWMWFEQWVSAKVVCVPETSNGQAVQIAEALRGMGEVNVVDGEAHNRQQDRLTE